MVCHSLDVKESNLSSEPDNNATLIPETEAFCTDPISDENKKALAEKEIFYLLLT